MERHQKITRLFDEDKISEKEFSRYMKAIQDTILLCDMILEYKNFKSDE